MIPKIIHYCWLSDEPIPNVLQEYISGWKKIMPDYFFKKWDKSSFDINSVKWVKDAYENKKWAFAADYIRAYALYTEGGIYLDSDVIVNKRFDDFLDSGFFSSIEYNHSFKLQIQSAIDSNGYRKEGVDYVAGLAIQAAVIGAAKGHIFPKELLDYYDTHSFVENGSLNMLPAPVIYSRLLEKRGFVYKNTLQNLSDDITIYKANVFAGFQSCDFSSIAIHMCAGSWVPKMNDGFVKRKIKKNLLLRKMYNTFFSND